MKGLSVLLFLTSPLLLLAQIGFDNFATVPCFSGEGSVVLPEGWLAYQTVDDVWNGELEPEACMSINEGGSVYSAMLDLSEALEGKPVFLRRTLQLDLAPNTIWSVYLNWWWNSGSYAMLQTDCADSSDCSALLFRIQVPNHPDSTQVLADDIRVFPFKESQEIAYGDIQGVGGCLPTQYFEEQILLEVIYVLYPNWEIVGNDLEIPALEFNYTPWFELVNDANFYDTFYHSYNAELNTHNYNVFWGHRLVAYNPDQGYPSADNSSFIDIEPGDGLGSSMQQNIVVTLGELGTWDQIVVAFQPHSFFRGALVEGSDSLRHNLELVFANAELCGGLIVEYPVEPGNGLVFHESSVEFGQGNCFIIKEDAYLKVGEDGALNYGLDGKGMLALHPGSRVVLEPGSYLQFGNTLVLEDKSGEDVPTYCDVFLHPGSTLSFAPSAKVKNFSPDERLKVRVHLMGGRVEFNALSAHERSHFEFIEFEEAHIAGIQVLGNPTSGPIRFRFDAPTDGQSRISVVDQLGNLLFTDYVSHMEGVNELLLPRLNTTGVVYLRVEHDGSSKVARVLIQP